jgi:ribonuclease P protein component
MLPAKHRLTKDKEFERVFKHSQASSNKLMRVKALKNSLGVNRFGLIVGAKISKKATVRNRIKRVLREIIRAELSELKPGFDIVIYCLPSIQKAEFNEIKAGFKKLATKLNLY